MTELIKNKTGIQPVSHRAGRWAMNDQYFELLLKYGYTVDCSVTPHVDWRNNTGATQNSKGTDYSNYPEEPYYYQGLLEVPVTIRRTHTVFGDSFRTKFKNAIMGSTVWLRPRKNNLQQMKWLVDYVVESQTDYIMFMLHSSEMMPGGSPTFQTKEDIEKLYADIAVLFKHMSKEYEGSTLKEYYKYKSGK